MAVVSLEIADRGPLANGKAFGDAGPYEQIRGTLRFSGLPVGELVVGPALPDTPPPDEAFLQLIADQIALLFGLHQDHARERLATTLAAVTLDLVGQLDSRALFQSILRHGAQLIDGTAGALYRLVEEGEAIELAATYGVVFYPFLLDGVAADPKLNQRDGIHPTAAGVDRMVAGILPKVEELVGRIRERSPP